MKNRDLLPCIGHSLFKGKVIVLYGTRRVGKTTLVKHIMGQYKDRSTRYFNCEDWITRQQLETTNTEELYKVLGKYDLVVMDEAQFIEPIGWILKIINDAYPEIQIIATGSSSFDLANKTGEPLVGRSRVFTLYPFSLNELGYDLIKLNSNIENILRFGLYPTVIEKTEEESKEELANITSGYLYKDILAIEGIKHSKVLMELLVALSLQMGNEISYNELSNKLGISVNTVIRYIDLLEKCFVIFVLPAFSRNLRNEVGIKSKKIYFYDLGIRNAIINNFAPLALRTDVGALWENFCIMELIKKRRNSRLFTNHYFWRTYDKQEIDFIEEYNGKIYGYELKYNRKAKIPKIFTKTYDAPVKIINKSNYFDVFLDPKPEGSC
ncbi:MAG: ATP-binding protein [Puniceicoccales bacterium]|nr:ATP-binding protein [Puniceicoccales bacterium]